MIGDIGKGPVEGRCRQMRRSSGTDDLTAKAKTAIDRTDVQKFQQSSVGVAVHDGFDRTCGRVTDRVDALFRQHRKFSRIGNELAGDGIARISTIDEIGHRCADADRISLCDPGDDVALLGFHEPCGNERVCACKRCGIGLGLAHLRVPTAATGVQITWSIRSAPQASMTRRSKPSAMPQDCGIIVKASRKSSSTG